MAVTSGFEVVLPGEQKQLVPVKKEPTRRQGGHECEFVDKPPEIVQTECPVCLQVLCKPYMVTCCCHSFCKSCIERLSDNNKPCPLCNAAFNIVHEKKLERTLNDFKVYCSYQMAGCEWKGSLGQLRDHLNEESQDEDHRFTGCVFAELQCTHCKGYVQRSGLRVHENEQCSERPYSCAYCHKYASTQRDVTTKHWPVCECRPVPCPNQCGVYPERQNLRSHVNNDCPLTEVKCDFQYAGCEVKLPRREMADHVTNYLAKHMTMLAIACRKQFAENDMLQCELVKSKVSIDELKKENQLLKVELDEVWKHCMLMSPCKFIVQDVIEHQRAKDWWYSPVFYSYRRGYKMCLGVNISGSKLRVYLMPGEYDDHLNWPFRFSVKIEVFSPSENKWMLIYNHKSRAGTRCSLLTCSQITWTWDSGQPLISHKFIKNNCLNLNLTVFVEEKI